MLRRTSEYKAIAFNVLGNVEYFILSFTEVSPTNDWGDGVNLLHLWDAEREGTQDCERANTIPTVFRALRTRYSVSLREAQ